MKVSRLENGSGRATRSCERLLNECNLSSSSPPETTHYGLYRIKLESPLLTGIKFHLVLPPGVEVNAILQALGRELNSPSSQSSTPQVSSESGGSDSPQSKTSGELLASLAEAARGTAQMTTSKSTSQPGPKSNNGSTSGSKPSKLDQWKSRLTSKPSGGNS